MDNEYDDYNKYFYNSKKGILFNKLFYYSRNNKQFINKDTDIVIKENLKKLRDSIIYCNDYNNKPEEMRNSDIHWEFTDFIINTAKYHREVDKSIELLDDIKKCRKEIKYKIYNYKTNDNELTNYVINIINYFREIIKNDVNIFNKINNDSPDIILEKILDTYKIKKYEYLINEFIKKIMSKYNILNYNKIINNLLTFLKYIINKIILKIKDIYYYNNNEELLNRIDIECSIDSINYYIKENRNIIIGILVRSMKDLYKYKHINNKYSQNIYNNIYKKNIPNDIKTFYDNYINILYLKSDISDLNNVRINFKKEYIGDKNNLFSKLIPEIKNENKYKIWYTNKENEKDYILIEEYNNNILKEIYNKIFINNDNRIIILNKEIVHDSNVKYDSYNFNININKILKRIYYNCNLNNNIIIKNRNIKNNMSVILSFINKDINTFLYLLYNIKMDDIKKDIYTVNYNTCYKILINYKIRIYTNGTETLFENILMWKGHIDEILVDDRIIDIHKVKDNILFLKYIQLLINYVNNNIHKINIKKNKKIYIKDMQKIKDNNILKNKGLYNNIIKLKKNVEKINNITFNLYNEEYNYNINYENIFLVRRRLINNNLIELEMYNSYTYFEYFISVIFLEYNKFSITESIKKKINNKLNKIKTIKKQINHNNIYLILFLKLIRIYNNNNNSILNIENFNLILKEKTQNIININSIQLNILNNILENKEILI